VNKKLEQLKIKQAQLKAQIQLELQKDKTKARKEDTRRKILIGAMVMDGMEKNEEYKNKIMQNLNKYLSSEKDRALFDLDKMNHTES
jgi:large subunit ribosomal protein L7/L12